MNKAFVKEPDEPDDLHCPRCGALGRHVAAVTIDAHLRDGERSPLASSACFCPTPTCDIAYFDGFGQVLALHQLKAPIYPKDPDAPICACFGLRADDVAADARAGNAAGVRLLLQRSKDRQDACALAAADGRCCADEVQRHYLKHWKK